jgi:DNA gyrase inhibitor GyrI
MTVQSVSLAVEIRDTRSQSYLGKRLHVTIPGDVGTPVAQGFRELFARLEESHVRPSAPPFLITSHPLGGGMDLELGVPCDRPPAEGIFIAGTLPGGRVAVTTHRGAYDKIAPVYSALADWIFTNGHAMAGPPREIYLTAPEVPIEEHVTEIHWPIT